MRTRAVALLLILAFLFSLAGCQFHSDTEPVVVGQSLPVFYVKRPKGAVRNPIDTVSFNAGGDLWMIDRSSPTAKPVNITGHITLGKGDVSDPSPSFDGKKVVFSMRCTTGSSGICSQDKTWDIWVYDFTNPDNPKLEPVIKDLTLRSLGDDTDPAFIPGGKIVFTSTRQNSTKDKLGYVYAGEDLRGPASVLHVVNLNGDNIQQISFHQAHERNPSVMQNGRILFSRWENVGDDSKFSLFSINPDGTDIRAVYGVHSPGDAFMSPYELPDGRIIATVMPLAGTSEGGALMLIDAKNYADDNDPAPGVSPGPNGFKGQKPATVFDIPIENKISIYGRYATPSPVYDGSQRVLVSYSTFQGIKKTGGGTPTSTPFEHADENPPEFGVYLFDLTDRSLKPVVLPIPAESITDPIAAVPRKEPPIIPPQINNDPSRVSLASDQGIIHIRSVYDTDHFGRFGIGVLTPEERVNTPIPQIAPLDPKKDRREKIADIATLKNPLLTTAAQRPARFIRVVEGLPSPVGLSVEAIGVTPFEMRRIVGYAPIEPDGSVKVKIPARVPISIQVLDAAGRAFQNETNWLQVQPGETLTCNGCHSPRHTESINSIPIAGGHANTLLRRADGAVIVGAATSNETMAETRSRLDPASLELSSNLIYEDVWTDPSRRAPDAALKYSYQDVTTATPSAGVINYAQHIQPIWDRSRPTAGGDRKCSSCHDGVIRTDTNPSGLSLQGSIVAGSGRFISYDKLLIGEVVFDNGVPVFETATNSVTLKRGLPLVHPGYSRRSYLVEKIFNEELHAERGLPVFGLDHSDFLTAAEKRIITEWIDVGAQYYNSPVDENGVLRSVAVSLNRQLFENARGGLYDFCSICHRAVENSGQTNESFVTSRFILTGNFDSDFAIASSMVTDINNADNSYILSRPMSTTAAIHPVKSNGKAYIQPEDQLYLNLKRWIESAKQQPQVLTLTTPYSLGSAVSP